MAQIVRRKIKKKDQKPKTKAEAEAKIAAEQKEFQQKKQAKIAAEGTKYFVRPEGQVNLLDNAVCIEVEFRRFTTERQLNLDNFDVQAIAKMYPQLKKEVESIQSAKTEEDKAAAKDAINKKMLRLKKEIIVSPELKEIQSQDGQISTYMRSQELTNGQLKRGVYLIPIKRYKAVCEHLDAYKAERPELVKAFLAAYPTRKEEAKKDLGPAYNESDYPSIGEMESKFHMEYYSMEFGVSKRIQTLDQDLFDRASEKMNSRMQDMYFEIANNLRAAFQQLIQKLVSALRPNEEGKRGRVYESYLGNILEFIDLFDDKNIVNDEDLSNLVNQAKGLLKGAGGGLYSKEDGTERLRTDDNFRDLILNGFEKLEDQMMPMVYEDDSREVAVF